MAKFKVTITTRKEDTYEVEAKSEEAAKELALDLFNQGEDGDVFSDVIDGPDDGSDVKVEKVSD